MERRYYIITPAKNEEKYIAFTLESMVRQTLKPVKWIIVDDGSTDKTKDIAEKYAKLYDWIEVVSIDNKEEKKLYGSKVVKAFNFGFNRIKEKEYDFIVKMDADLSFEANYFEEVAKAFDNNEKLGIVGGYLIEEESDYEKKLAQLPYVKGAIKSVRSVCFNEIGGFVEANGWDGLDQLKSMYLGWEVKHIPLKVVHHRIQTTDYRSLDFFYNNGIAHYRMGNNLLLTFIRSLILIKEKPYLLASMSYFRGFVKSAIYKEPRLVDKELAKFIRSYHYKKILKFKR